MKVQNTLTQKELEILLRFANWAHTTFEWRFGQAIFNGLHIMFPATAEEIRGKEFDPFYRDTVKADFYAAICPDEPREEYKHPAFEWWDNLTKEEQVTLEIKYGYYGHDEGTSEKEVILMYRDETGSII